MTTIDITYVNDDDEEFCLTLPACREVCPECDGTGTVLCEGMRGACYSVEEFQESFDEEEAEEYFRRGDDPRGPGRYDVVCTECHGRNVILVVDEDHIPANLSAEYQEYLKYEEKRAQWDAEDRATYRMESGYRE